MFASAGIGITPMAGMLSHLAAARFRPDHHGPARRRRRGTFALRRQVVATSSRCPTPRCTSGTRWARTTTADGRARRADGPRRRDLAADAAYYLCGPIPFMQAVRGGLIERGVAPSDIQYEVFGPDLWQADLD